MDAEGEETGGIGRRDYLVPNAGQGWTLLQ
jgi:hypothetical protein